MSGPTVDDELYGLTREQILTSLVGLAKHMGRLSNTSRRPDYNYAEAAQDAMLAAILAIDADQYSPGKTSYTGYLSVKMKYGIMDGLRSRDIVKRRATWDPADRRLMPAAALDRVANHGPSTFGEMLADPSDGYAAVDDADEYDHQVVMTRARLAALEPRWRYVIEQYYLAGRNLKDIGDELGVTESRISQIRRKAIEAMRDEDPLAGIPTQRSGAGH